ncbi:hypothetical protein CEXT_653361 [Caerostris extrusa]|uniref:Ribosomal protein L32 n=1 Tax=Caerostris extrusa TaxID=172846 RepID=A0AAV4PC86_CAEEX|nr:hypothetical protein CEXT_653361 [Caerostris extrusa]
MKKKINLQASTYLLNLSHPLQSFVVEASKHTAPRTDIFWAATNPKPLKKHSVVAERKNHNKQKNFTKFHSKKLKTSWLAKIKIPTGFSERVRQRSPNARATATFMVPVGNLEDFAVASALC